MLFLPAIFSFHGPLAQQQKDFCEVQTLIRTSVSRRQGEQGLHPHQNNPKAEMHKVKGQGNSLNPEINPPHTPHLCKRENLCDSKCFSPSVLGTLDIWIPYLEPSACLLKCSIWLLRLGTASSLPSSQRLKH